MTVAEQHFYELTVIHLKEIAEQLKKLNYYIAKIVEYDDSCIQLPK